MNDEKCPPLNNVIFIFTFVIGSKFLPISEIKNTNTVY